ncbi:MAG: hypothetical protein KGI06_04850 [Candidatus Micrarchaeota archaeon]|nr:hypothetical protein [Candidatus Micrarchaeota archaeon]
MKTKTSENVHPEKYEAAVKEATRMARLLARYCDANDLTAISMDFGRSGTVSYNAAGQDRDSVVIHSEYHMRKD